MIVRTIRVLLAALWTAAAAAQLAEPVHVRNLNPLVAVFGLPAWDTVPIGTRLGITAEVANHYRFSVQGDDLLMLDGETVRTNVARMLLAIAFLLSRDHFVGLIAISIFFATASQFFGTTDAVTVPSVVPKNQLMAANSVFSMAVTGSQLIGMIFLAPILLPTVGASWLFFIARPSRSKLT